MSVLSEELKNSQFQTLRFKRERDSYKQILDSADSNHQKGNYKVQNNDNQVPAGYICMISNFQIWINFYFFKL